MATYTEAKRYFEDNAKAAQDSSLPLGVFPSVTLAQGAIESAYGTSYLSKNGKNDFGIKLPGFPLWKDYITLPSDNNRETTIQYRRYQDKYQGFLDHANFLKNNSRYKAALQAKDAISQAQLIADPGAGITGYSENKEAYKKLLVDIIKTFDLTKYDMPNEVYLEKKN